MHPEFERRAARNAAKEAQLKELLENMTSSIQAFLEDNPVDLMNQQWIKEAAIGYAEEFFRKKLQLGKVSKEDLRQAKSDLNDAVESSGLEERAFKSIISSVNDIACSVDTTTQRIK